MYVTFLLRIYRHNNLPLNRLSRFNQILFDLRPKENYLGCLFLVEKNLGRIGRISFLCNFFVTLVHDNDTKNKVSDWVIPIPRSITHPRRKLLPSREGGGALSKNVLNLYGISGEGERVLLIS